jgi:hypothetical protein
VKNASKLWQTGRVALDYEMDDPRLLYSPRAAASERQGRFQKKIDECMHANCGERKSPSPKKN